MPPDRVLLLEPRGTCGGVDAAISALAWLVLLDLPRLHCVHHIVHNEHVVARFEALGVTFVDDADHVPAGATVLLSAHGTPPRVVDELRARCPVVLDAVCPLVAKVHREVAARHAAGDRILYVGRPGHDETDAVLALAPAGTVLVEEPAAIDALPDPVGSRAPAGVAVLAQTTLRTEEVEAVEAAARRRFGPVWTPARSDICDASTTRQAAVRLVAGGCDAVVVVGSASSSNTASLVTAALEAGAPRAIRVATAGDLPGDLAGTVAVTAGASTPDWLVEEVLDHLDPDRRAEVVAGPPERSTRFPLPTSVRRLVDSRSRAGALAPELAALARDQETTAEALLRHAEARSRLGGAG